MTTAKQLTAKKLTHVNRMTTLGPDATIFVEPAGTPGNFNMHIGDETICWPPDLFNNLLMDMLTAKGKESKSAEYLKAANVLAEVLLAEMKAAQAR